jgi:hypothetical protein
MFKFEKEVIKTAPKEVSKQSLSSVMAGVVLLALFGCFR